MRSSCLPEATFKQLPAASRILNHIVVIKLKLKATSSESSGSRAQIRERKRDLAKLIQNERARQH